MKSGILLALTAVLAGCATAQGPAFEKKQAVLGSVIYVYRPDNQVLITYPLAGVTDVPMTVVCGFHSASLEPGGYHAFPVDAGTTSCSSLSAESSTLLNVNTLPGKSYYVKGTLGPGYYAPHPKLTLVSTDVTPAAIQQCRMQ
jgi:hypothetical protein